MCTQTSILTSFDSKFDDIYKTCSSSGKSITLDGTKVAKCANGDIDYSFKKIPSLVTHTSPNKDDLKSQIQSMITPSLPIDRDRYVDFIAANGVYKKLNYPYFFRIQATNKNPEISDYKNVLKNTLALTSGKMNNIISSSSPDTLSGKDKEIYDLLKTGEYPTPNVDLYSYFSSKPTKMYTLS
jgi:hypothetical protein